MPLSGARLRLQLSDSKPSAAPPATKVAKHPADSKAVPPSTAPTATVVAKPPSTPSKAPTTPLETTPGKYAWTPSRQSPPTADSADSANRAAILALNPTVLVFPLPEFGEWTPLTVDFKKYLQKLMGPN